jgi:hypothetical protein
LHPFLRAAFGQGYNPGIIRFYWIVPHPEVPGFQW